MRFVHSSDWQIGRVFRFADDITLGVLSDARLDVIGRLGALARAQNAPSVLVAGDIYDVERPSDRTLRQPIERMAAAPDIAWHLIPGNHDPHRPGGAWDRLLRNERPANIHLHLDEQAADIGGATLLPAVLREKHASGDPTEAFDAMRTPEGAIRIGLAHGSVRGFGDNAAAHNRIAIDRAQRAGLAYLALGDWHGAQEAGARTWYSGTPETDDFSTGGRGGGEALVVDVAGPAAPPSVAIHRIGRFRWQRDEARLFNQGDIDALDARVRALSPSLDEVLVWLEVTGSLSLVELTRFEWAVAGLGAALRLLRLDRDGLRATPETADLDAIERAGPIRQAAERLSHAAATDPIAAAALLRLAHMARQSAEDVA
jgi:DNA repair exonuclease SbcCD nuclease subunit